MEYELICIYIKSFLDSTYLFTILYSQIVTKKSISFMFKYIYLFFSNNNKFD